MLHVFTFLLNFDQLTFKGKKNTQSNPFMKQKQYYFVYKVYLFLLEFYFFLL